MLGTVVGDSLILIVLIVLIVLELLVMMMVVVVGVRSLLGVVDRVVHLSVVNVIVRELLASFVNPRYELRDGAEGPKCFTVM